MVYTPSITTLGSWGHHLVAFVLAPRCPAGPVLRPPSAAAAAGGEVAAARAVETKEGGGACGRVGKPQENYRKAIV